MVAAVRLWGRDEGVGSNKGVQDRERWRGRRWMVESGGSEGARVGGVILQYLVVL